MDAAQIAAMIADREAGTPGSWSVFVDDSGDRWTGWPLSVNCDVIADKTIVRTGGMWPYEWDAKTSQHEACANARRIARVPDMESTIIDQAAEIATLRAERDALPERLIDILHVLDVEAQTIANRISGMHGVPCRHPDGVQVLEDAETIIRAAFSALKGGAA